MTELDQLVDPRGEELFLEGTGDEAVVAIHGFTGCPGHWRMVAPQLQAAGYTVLCPRLPGHGSEPDDLRDVTIQDWKRAVVEAAARVSSRRRVHLVGLSLGGLLAIVAARETAAASIATINAPILYRDWRAYLLPFVSLVRPEVDRSDEPLPPTDEEAAALFFTYRRFPTRAATGVVRLSLQALVEARRLRRPSLVVQSRADESVHPRSGTLLHRRLGATSRLVWLDQSIHNAILGSRRDQLASTLLHHLSQTDRPRFAHHS